MLCSNVWNTHVHMCEHAEETWGWCWEAFLGFCLSHLPHWTQTWPDGRNSLAKSSQPACSVNPVSAIWGMELQAAVIPTWHFPGLWASELQSFCLYNKCFFLSSHLPSPGTTYLTNTMCLSILTNVYRIINVFCSYFFLKGRKCQKIKAICFKILPFVPLE